ncbi:transposase [Orientia tsutsugamushi]|uniref:Transposase n=1 Tax=Orientia tsutsugamushi TaxID=784 RepID=A0A2R8F0D5_ORITS|nr:transposase [Orientia tsutsugamushi]
MSLAELLTIAIYFYVSSCKDCKNYYLYYLSYKYKGYFCLPSYSRIIQLWPRMLLPLVVLTHYLKGEETGIYYFVIINVPPAIEFLTKFLKLVRVVMAGSYALSFILLSIRCSIGKGAKTYQI